MKHSIHPPVSAVQFRRRIQQTLDYAAGGLLLAACIVLFSPLLAGLVFLASVLLGLVRPHTFSLSARLIDKHYNLKDRIFTSLALLRHSHRTPMEQLQVDDAAEHLVFVRPQTVQPIRFPKMFWIATGVFVLDLVAMTLIHGNFFSYGKDAGQVETMQLVKDTALLEEILAKTEELVQDHAGEPSLKTLSEQMEMLLKQFAMEGMDMKKSLLTLSEMEAAFQSALDSLQLETMEESLAELAKTLELAEKTLPISIALEKRDYSRAAMELRQLDAETLESLSKPEQKTMAEALKSIADNAEKRNQKLLQEAAQKMSDALDNNDGESGVSAADELANEVEKHGIRQAIGRDLARQQMLLAMMKADGGQGNMSGGTGTDKSETASDTWGSGSAGNPNAGLETNLEGERQQEKLTGTLGEQGESLTETVDSQETTAERGRRDYLEQYRYYQKISEAVLDSEPIPLGQRQVIRRYFESIRPSSAVAN